MQSYFKFVEYGYGNTYEIIFPLKSNYQAYRILSQYFGKLSDSSYFVYKFEITTDKTDEIDYEKLNLSKNVRVCNGLIDCSRLRKWITELEDGDDHFQDLGILNICAFFQADFN